MTSNWKKTLDKIVSDNHVPVLQAQSIEFIKLLMKLTRPKRILEIGTAIGYTSLHLASFFDGVIETIERDERMVALAKCHFELYDINHQIIFHEGDALDLPIEVFGRFDLILIDAAKAQNQKFFEKFRPLLNDGGIVLTDNVLFHGLVGSTAEMSKNLKHMVQKIENYLGWLEANYPSTILQIGDGMAYTRVKEDS